MARNYLIEGNQAHYEVSTNSFGRVIFEAGDAYGNRNRLSMSVEEAELMLEKLTEKIAEAKPQRARFHQLNRKRLKGEHQNGQG